ncbi:hypothetical protein RclHR1_16050006 [Rhizophagus clarus]|uniref:Uncharacterized protein n=1 Tax=Rhizophagus clarus TaxID=94130 RepID=A0A2Z6QUA9_9GLOM|nr:hypothetical protein RclHR1_16050006 [Rhizophagus clarus]
MKSLLKYIRFYHYDQIEEATEALKADQEELNKYFRQIDKELINMILRISTINNSKIFIIFIKFYGLTNCEKYVVVVRAEYGNLREFYTNYKSLFNLKLKLRIALDIACRLELRTAEVKIFYMVMLWLKVYITPNYAAKLSDFRFMHAEISEICWKIAEEAIPYQDCDDFVK